MWLYLNIYNPSPTAKSTPIAKVSFCKECKKEICPKHQYGTMYAHYHLTNCHQLKSSTVGFHVKGSVLQDLEKAWRMSVADYFSKSCAWPKKSSHNSYSLKTFQLLQPCLLYTSPSPRDRQRSRMPSSA